MTEKEFIDTVCLYCNVTPTMARQHYDRHSTLAKSHQIVSHINQQSIFNLVSARDQEELLDSALQQAQELVATSASQRTTPRKVRLSRIVVNNKEWTEFKERQDKSDQEIEVETVEIEEALVSKSVSLLNEAQWKQRQQQLKKRKTEKELDAEEEYEVEKILKMKKSKGHLIVKVKWRDYEEPTWEPFAEIVRGCAQLVEQFLLKQSFIKRKKKKDNYK